MNILFVYSRDVDLNDSGGARTTILLLKHLVTKPDVKCYTLFNIAGDTVLNLTIIQREGDFSEQLRQTVINHSIDIVMVPEAVLLGKQVSYAIKGLNCRVVSALHNKPGYEKQNLHLQLLESMFFNKNLLKRIRAALGLIIYPILYPYYVYEKKKMFRAAYENTDILVLLSPRFFTEFIKEYRIKDGGKKLRAVGNGLSFDRYASHGELLAKKKQIVVVSRYDERQKRLSRVFKVWRELQNELKDWRLVIVGFGRSEKYYNYLVSKYKLKNIDLVGMQSPQGYYLESSIFLMTSDYEGWGMTITEAQQCGCVPVVLDTFSSLHDILQDGDNGYIAKDLAEMKKRILEVAGNSEKLVKMANQAIESSKRYEPAYVYEGYYDIFKELEKK